MKRILFVVIIITLPLIAYFQYKKYTRFNPPSQLEYVIADNIDVNYHNQSLVSEYYRNAVEIGAFARSKWSNESIDVRFPDQNDLVQVNAAKYYNQLVARTKELEVRLQNAAVLKSKGYSNNDIIKAESGIPSDLIESKIDRTTMEVLRIGDRNRFVWKLQEKLISKGYPHLLDGLFGTDTQNALIRYQNDQGLFPSGAMNPEVFDELFLK
ncbi:MAG: peptidoglycan-binding domain-containing protein [Cyclobacteriaceae bacterium]